MKSGVLLITLALLLRFSQACPASKRKVVAGAPGAPGSTGAPGSPGPPGTPEPGTFVPETTEKTTETTINPVNPFLKPEGAILEIVTKTIYEIDEEGRLDLRICGGDTCPVQPYDIFIFPSIQIHKYLL
jgi:hypothetical protein